MARRTAWSVLVLFAASTLCFVIVRVTTDPLTVTRASLNRGDVDPEAAARLLADERDRLGLHRPLAAQYGHWLAGVAHGDWGESLESHRPVAADVRSRLWNTVQLIAFGIVLAVAVAILVGVVSGARQYSAADHALSGLSFVALSMPSFWFALMAIEVLIYFPRHALHLDHPLLYSVGLHSPSGGLLDYARHLALPVMTLSLPLVAAWSRYIRASMIDALSAPYVQAATAKGLSRRQVLLGHVLRNALIPFTTVSAVGIGQLFGGVIVTEAIFSWPGMGQLLLQALSDGDTNMLLAWLMVAATFALGLNLLADILNGVLDPRARS